MRESIPLVSDLAAELVGASGGAVDVGLFSRVLRRPVNVIAEVALGVNVPFSGATSQERLQRFLRDSVVVVSKAANVAASEEAAIEWYWSTAISEFDALTPAQLVGKEQTSTVLMYLTSIEAGSTG